MALPNVMYGGYGAPATTALAATPLTSWQDTLRARVESRDKHERAWDSFIERYQKLAQHAATLKERNTSLLVAASQASLPATAAAGGGSGSGSGSGSGTPSGVPVSNPVQEAYVKSLEGQIGTLRDELASLYKTQSQNAQRLLELNEVLRTRDEGSKALESEYHTLTMERDRLARQTSDQRDALRAKDSTVQLLQDELNTLSLELNQVEQRNDDLSRDNAQLLQRWLDAKNEEVHRMNDANVYLEEIERRRSEVPDQTAMPPPSSDAEPGETHMAGPDLP